MYRFVILTMTGLLGLFILTGCEKEPNSVISEEQIDENAIRDILTDENLGESEYLIDWGIDDENENQMFNGFSTFSTGSTFPGIFSPIDSVVSFGRILNRQIPRTLAIRRISPDTVIVHLERIWGGRFIIIEQPLAEDSLIFHQKRLLHIVNRTAILTRQFADQEPEQDSRRRWKLTAISMVSGKSRPVATLQIHQMEITTGSGEHYVYEEPLRTYFSLPDDLPLLQQGERVTVRVLVSNNNTRPCINPETGATETLLLHYGINRFHRARKQFEFRGIDPATGYHIFVGEWTVHEPALRPFHAVVDAIDNGTIYDDDEQLYPYNSVSWGLPYRVVSSK